jgi:hypothetical protein
MWIGRPTQDYKKVQQKYALIKKKQLHGANTKRRVKKNYENHE